MNAAPLPRTEREPGLISEPTELKVSNLAVAGRPNDAMVNFSPDTAEYWFPTFSSSTIITELATAFRLGADRDGHDRPGKIAIDRHPGAGAGGPDRRRCAQIQHCRVLYEPRNQKARTHRLKTALENMLNGI